MVQAAGQFKGLIALSAVRIIEYEMPAGARLIGDGRQNIQHFGVLPAEQIREGQIAPGYLILGIFPQRLLKERNSLREKAYTKKCAARHCQRFGAVSAV